MQQVLNKLGLNAESKWKLTCPSGNVIQITFICLSKEFWSISKIEIQSPTSDNDEARNLSNLIQSIIGRSNRPSVDLDFKLEVIAN